MNNSGNTGFAYDYALLRATPGCDLEELKRCYRLAVRELHPDRNPELAANSDAQDALSELTLAYRRLHDYHRAYGRLPGELPRRQAPGVEAAADKAPVRGRRGRWIAFAAFAIAGLYWLWPAPSGDPGAVPVQAAPAPAAGAPATDALGFKDPYAAAAPARRKAVRIGDSKRDVRAALGPPIFGTAEVWEYGPSHVRFKEGRVIDWYSSPLKPIAVDEASRKLGADGTPQAE